MLILPRYSNFQLQPIAAKPAPTKEMTSRTLARPYAETPPIQASRAKKSQLITVGILHIGGAGDAPGLAGRLERAGADTSGSVTFYRQH